MKAGPRKLALASGELFYIGGKICPKGHNGPRYTKTGQCVACTRSDENLNMVDRRRDRHRFNPRSCEQCGIEMSRRNQKWRTYCSHKCSNLAGANGAKPVVKKSCELCGEHFYGKSAQRYCSDPCREEGAWQKASTLPRHFASLIRQEKTRKEKISVAFLAGMYAKQNGRCAISGVTMTSEIGRGTVSTNISIDRIDSSVGYEPENVQLVCRIVNIMKTSLPLGEFLEWCRIIATANP